jgi:pilus assembly protein CpaE
MENHGNIKDDKIRVLIVDSNPESREKLRDLLSQQKDIEVIGAARTGREAIDLAQDMEPDVVVLDVNIPDMEEIAATEAICRRVPFTQVVILAVQVDPNYMRKAMLSGARDFIVKPPMPDELRSAVYRAGVLAHERKSSTLRGLPASTEDNEFAKQQSASRGRIIQIYSPKGGTGTTTIAANLAIALHTPETKVILVDGNLQFGDIGIFMNETGYHSILDLTARVNDLDPDVIGSVIINHPASGVDIMVAPTRPEMAEKITGEEYYKVLQYLRRLYSYIIVDTPTALNEINLSILDASDVIVLVTTQEIPAIKNSRLFLSVLDGLRINRQRVVFLLNRYDKQIALPPDKIAENLKQEIVSIIPLDVKTATRSENQGQPFVLDHKNEPISKAIIGLADVVRNRLATLTSADASKQRMRREVV